MQNQRARRIGDATATASMQIQVTWNFATAAAAARAAGVMVVVVYCYCCATRLFKRKAGLVACRVQASEDCLPDGRHARQSFDIFQEEVRDWWLKFDLSSESS